MTFMIGHWSRPSATLSIGVFILLVNSAYLAAFADPTLFYFANVVAHTGARRRARVPLRCPLVRHRHRAPRGADSWAVGPDHVASRNVLAGVAIMFTRRRRPILMAVRVHIV